MVVVLGTVYRGPTPTFEPRTVENAIKVEKRLFSDEIESRYQRTDGQDDSLEDVMTLIDFCKKDMICS